MDDIEKKKLGYENYVNGVSLLLNYAKSKNFILK
jgi:hypothetical protein